MEIHELTERQSTLDTGVYLPVDDGDVTQKIDYPRLAQAIIEQYTASSLGGSYRSIKTAMDAIKTTVDAKVNTSDVVNNVVTTAAGKVLDARQGKTLNDAISTLNTKTNGSVLADMASGYSAISSSSGRAVFNRLGSLCILDLQLVRSSAITSGSMSLPSSMPTPWSTFHGTLVDINNGSVGHIEVNTNRTLYLRCQAGSGFLTGQLVYITA